LKDTPDGEYLTSQEPPRGEICIWGPTVMKAFFKNADTGIENEWLCTGDIGEVNENGSIKFIDRASSIFKIKEEYVLPERLENIYMQSEFISQIWVYGDEGREYLVALIVLDPIYLKKMAKERGGALVATAAGPDDENFDYAPILEDLKVKLTIHDDLLRLAAQFNLKEEEKPK
jgi:long-chain acyl-CoA synthetase